MLRYIFRILFSSLRRAVKAFFVAGNIRGVLVSTFCFWACNSPYFILVFLLSYNLQFGLYNSLINIIVYCTVAVGYFRDEERCAAPAERFFTDFRSVTVRANVYNPSRSLAYTLTRR